MLKEILRRRTHHAALTPTESACSSSLQPQSRKFMVWKNCTLVVIFLVVGCVGVWAQATEATFCQPSCSATADYGNVAPDWEVIGIDQSFQANDALVSSDPGNSIAGPDSPAPSGVTYNDPSVPWVTQGQASFLSTMGIAFNATMGTAMNMVGIWGHNAWNNLRNAENGTCGQCGWLLGINGGAEVEGMEMLMSGPGRAAISNMRRMVLNDLTTGDTWGTQIGNHLVKRLGEIEQGGGPLSKSASAALDTFTGGRGGNLSIQEVIRDNAALRENFLNYADELDAKGAGFGRESDGEKWRLGIEHPMKPEYYREYGLYWGKTSGYMKRLFGRGQFYQRPGD